MEDLWCREKGLDMPKSKGKKAVTPASAPLQAATDPVTASPAAQPPASQPLVTSQPQSKQQAAVNKGMFLYTDDAWSQRYFDPNDLRHLERELFG
jgi:hypothetical protein